jgi:trehalose 6-phosphate phosphatase
LQFDPRRNLTASDCALFLDFDGTLVDIAATPHSVKIPNDLAPLIEGLLAAFETRVCIVTGRTVSDINRYLGEIKIDIIAEHGAVPCLQGLEASHLPDWPASWSDHLLTVDKCISNLVVEAKKTAVALHYRQQPELEPEVLQLAELLRNHAPSEYMVVNSNMTTEIRRANIDKGTAIKAAMQSPRYRDRMPIFIADDVTDIPGFNAVQELGGLALHVGADFAGKTANVRHWLAWLAGQQKAA